MRHKLLSPIQNPILKVTWEIFEEWGTNSLVDLYTGLVVKERDIPVCDVCNFDDLSPKVLPDGEVPLVHGVFIVTKMEERRHTTSAPFGLCADCQAAMNIKPGDTGVPLEQFKDQWLKVMRATCKKLGWPKTAYAPEIYRFYVVEF